MIKCSFVFGMIGVATWVHAATITASASASTRDPMSVFYGNTILSRHGDGLLARVFFNADGTFSVTVKGRMIRSGTYTYSPAKDEVCLDVKQDIGSDPRHTLCRAAHTDVRVGDSWPDTDHDGKPERQTLIAGRL